MRLATIGHRPYFMNHYAEGASGSSLAKGFDFDHFSWDFMRDVTTFRPDVTLIYRPEMFPAQQLRAIPGYKIGFSTEPMPKFVKGRVARTRESDIREPNYRNLLFEEYDAIYHYDRLSQSYFESIGWHFTQNDALGCRG